jgi:hypothetical protein
MKVPVPATGIFRATFIDETSGIGARHSPATFIDETPGARGKPPS